MTRWFKDSMALGRTASPGFEREHGDVQDSFGPAIGLTLAAGASLVLWFGLAHAVAWAAHALF